MDLDSVDLIVEPVAVAVCATGGPATEASGGGHGG